MSEAPELDSMQLVARVRSALSSHESRTALDLTKVDSLRVVVCLTDHARLKQELGNLPFTVTGSGATISVGGIPIVVDHDLFPGEVRLRTEIEA